MPNDSTLVKQAVDKRKLLGKLFFDKKKKDLAEADEFIKTVKDPDDISNAKRHRDTVANRGNDKNVVQATAVNQPRIVNAGVLELRNGKPTVNSIGIQGSLITPVGNTVTAQHISVVAGWNGAIDFSGLVGQGNVTGQPEVGIRTRTPNILENGGFTTGGGIYYNNGAFIASGTNLTIGNTGVQFTLLAERPSPLTFNRFGIGAYQQLGRYWNGNTSEVIVFPSLLSTANRSLLATNQGAFYSINA